MERGTAKTATAGAAVLVAVALGAWLVFASRESAGSPAQNGNRAEVLRLAEHGRLSDSEKKRVFELLSGEQFREYEFSARERAQILKAIGG